MANDEICLARREEDREIDLGELLLFVCRKWRILIALGLVGLVLGVCVGRYKSEPHLEDLDLQSLHLKEIERYARYQELYDSQIAWEKESVYLNMDPNAAFTGNVSYYLRLRELDSPVVSRLYGSILDGNGVICELIEAGGLNCSERAIRELIEIGYTVLDQNEAIKVNDDRSVNVRVNIGVTAPDGEACKAMMDLLDNLVQEMNQYVETAYGAVLKERLETPCEQKSYHRGIVDAKIHSTELLNGYASQISTIEKSLTSDDKTYYGLVYGQTEEKAEQGSLSWLKWAILMGGLFGAVGVFGFAVVYLLDGHIKNVNELTDCGLHLFAVLGEGKPGRKLNALDRLFAPRLRCQTDEYLAKALDVLDAESIVLCGDLSDSDIAEHAGNAQKASCKLSVEEQMMESADTQMKVKQADGVVLFVHLWKTKRSYLEQEIRICQKIGGKILGVAVIG